MFIVVVIIIIIIIIIINSHALFHLRWKENLVKHQKVSKYYDQDCSTYRITLPRDGK